MFSSTPELEESRRVLRPINARIINLTKHIASQLQMFDSTLTIQFERAADREGAFCLQLGRVIGFVDRGLLFQPLTTGLVWGIAGAFGRENALDVGYEDTTGLIELRIDYQDEHMHCRIQVVAQTAKVWDGPITRQSI
jgi:hypothetical protein